MYQEWMDAVPLLCGDGFEEYDIEQLQKAKKFYIERGMLEHAKNIDHAISEKRKCIIEREHINTMGFFQKRRYIKMKEELGMSRNQPLHDYSWRI